jgi:hypothetical protein
MRKVLAIMAALMLSAVILSPAMGYTFQSVGNQSYSISSSMVNYSIRSGTPAQDIMPGMIPSETPAAAAVTTTKVPYSMKAGTAVPYSLRLESSANFVTEGEMAPPQVAALGSLANSQSAATQSARVTSAPAAKLSIMGIVFDDSNSNGIKEASELGLSGWALNLEQPAGTIIAKTNSSESGNYAFNNLAPGEYVLSAVLPMGWSIVIPADGRYTINLTDTNATDMNFAAIMHTPENVTAMNRASFA